ncbi:MAG: nucleotidyltransferase domain-containing protein [Lachnospiraceae bacterium]|nr:nucleotidyltransferase domain-containing protein [Lachnospiraceae bacterium]
MERYKNTGIKQAVIDEICNIAKNCNVDKVILFGSRARGDYKDRSDIDLAVSGGKVDIFAITVDEETSTLLKYDIVNLNASIQEELLESIQKEGITVYEKV